jgi:O-antigen ligase
MILLCGSILFHFSGELGLIKEGVSRRINRTFSHEDPSSGRIAIAQETISLISEKPFLGYSFDSFSRYHDGHSTPHNQYLEVLFKAGLLGFFSYFFFVFVLLYFVVKNKHRSYFLNYNNIYIKSFLCVFFAISIGNLTQPNFSYSQTGNVLFAMLGFLSFCKR